MTDRPHEESSIPKSVGGTNPENAGSASKTKPPEVSKANDTSPGSAIPKTLTPDEQMALYEKELKENDWGHQPC